MTNYTKLVKALRCKREDCEGCDLAFFDKDEGWMCRYAVKDDDAADAIEELEAKHKELHGRIEDKELQIDMLTADNTNYEIAIDELKAQLPKWGEWKTTRPDAPMFGFYYCSICGRKRTSPQDNYCPNCGAKMTEVRE
jgi:hypothetical protein